MENNDDSGKKAVTKRKLVDLKAVSNLAEDHNDDNVKNISGSTLKFRPNEELIHETSRIKNQRDLITKRLDKMNQAKNRVSKTVFEKVYRDYRLQLDGIGKLLHEKKEVLARELESLYVLREKCVLEVNRHKEVLEEARFRHFLEEFTEEQYKEVEGFETKEIERFQADLAQVQSFMRIHEELFDAQELKYPTEQAKEVPVTNPEPTKTVPQQTNPTPPAPTTNHTRTVLRQDVSDDFMDKTPTPSAKVEAIRDDSISQQISPNDPVSASSDYFSAEPSITEPSKEIVNKEPENIFDVLEDMPLEKEEVSETVSKVEAEKTPTPVTKQAEAASTATAYKLVFIETDGDADMTEFPMKDNVSIGRSPSNDLVLNTPKVSRQHAAINKYKDQFVIIDLKSSNGIFVNGRKVDEHTLNDGDEITVGGYKMIFKKS